MASSDLDGHDFPDASWMDSDVPLVALDLASVETYLLIRLLSRNVPETGRALWCPLESGPANFDLNHREAEDRAAELGLTVTWPSEHWTPVPRAMRVAALAMTHRCAETYIRAMTRTAFAAGMNVNKVSAPIEPKRSHLLDPEPYYVAVNKKLGLSGPAVTRATRDGSKAESRLRTIAGQLAELEITQAPALRLNGSVLARIRQ
jgi:2-hydroxychromene-2-carboxylate isomerase